MLERSTDARFVRVPLRARLSVDTLLPSQFADRIARSLQPEKRLMLAVLEGAVGDFQKYATAPSGRGRRLFSEAEAWFESTAAGEPFDFENICHTLGFDPSFIRGGLQRWRIARRRQAIVSEPVPSWIQGGHA